MKKHVKDRPIYIPQPRRLLSLQKNVKDNTQFVELLGRYGRINHYEFEFTNDCDAALAASSYARYGDFSQHGASLVTHVEAPPDSVMSRKIIHSRVMQADLMEKAEPVVRRRFLESHELLLPASKQNVHWSTTKSSSSENMSMNEELSSQMPHKTSLRPKSLQKRDRCHAQRRTPSDDKTQMKTTNHFKEIHKTKTDAIETDLNLKHPNISSLPEYQEGHHSHRPKPCNEASMTVPFTAFENEIRRRFPSCFARRLLIAMWVNLCRFELCLSPANPQPKLPLESTSLSIDARHSGTLLTKAMTFADAMVYFKNLLDEFLKESSQTKSREASHFFAYLCIIVGDICRYRDIHEAKHLHSYVKNGTLDSEEYQRRNALLFIEAADWYDQAAKYFPWESRIYTQLSDLYFRKNDILHQISSTLRSIVCAFRSHNEDVLTVLLETGSTTGSAVPFVPRLLSIVQSLYCKISLDQFDTRLESLCHTLNDQIAATITSTLLDTLLSSFQLLVYLMIETSSLWKEEARLGDSVDSLVKSIQLKLVRLPDGRLEYCVDTDKCNYEQLKLTLSNHYELMSLSYSYAFATNLDIVLEAIESGERFALTCITFCRLANVILNNIKSPLSLLLGVLYFIFAWLSHTGFLFLYEAPHQGNPLQSNPLHEVLRKELSTLKKQFSYLLFDYGNELLKVQQLKHELLEYSLPEDDYLTGCIELPLEYCCDPKYQDHETSVSAAMVLPSHLFHSLKCPYFCGGKSGNLPNFLHLNGMLGPMCEENAEIQSSLREKDMCQTLSNQDAQIENNRDSLCLTDDDDVSSQSDTVDSNSYKAFCTGDSHNVEEDFKSNQQTFAKIDALNACDAEIQNGNQEKTISDHTTRANGVSHHTHVKACKPCCNNKSFVRLSRLLLIAETLPEFRSYCEEKKSEILKMQFIDEAPQHLTDCQTTTSQNREESLVTATKQVDTQVEPSRERRGILKVNCLMRPREQEAKTKDNQRRSRRKLAKAHTSHKHYNAEARLFSTGSEIVSHSIHLGNPRPSLRSPCASSARPSGPETPALEHLLVTDSLEHVTNVAETIPANYIPPTLSCKPKRTLIVIDGSNVALRHGSGKEKKFSSIGIKIVLDYFLLRNFNAIAFVPEYLTNFKDVGDNMRLRNANIGKNKATKIPDNVQLLRDLSSQGLLITTPPQDYDDSYIIQYAMNHEGYIVSNDRYRDHTGKEPNHVRQWLRVHLISFTFVNDEFMPNPDFVFPTDNT